MHGRRVPWWSLTDTSAPASAGDTQCPAGSPAGRSQPKYMQDTKEKNNLLVSDVLNPRSFHREDRRGRGTCGKRSGIEPVAWKKMSTEPRGTEKPPRRATAVPGRPCSPARPERRTGVVGDADTPAAAHTGSHKGDRKTLTRTTGLQHSRARLRSGPPAEPASSRRRRLDQGLTRRTLATGQTDGAEAGEKPANQHWFFAEPSRLHLPSASPPPGLLQSGGTEGTRPGPQTRGAGRSVLAAVPCDPTRSGRQPLLPPRASPEPPGPASRQHKVTEIRGEPSPKTPGCPPAGPPLHPRGSAAPPAARVVY